MMKASYFKLLMLGCALACAGCATMEHRNGGVAYEVDIDGAGWSLGRVIRESTSTCKFVERSPSTVGQLRHRMAKDQKAIESILKSNGYYDGTVNLYLDTTRQPARVDIKVWRGKPYRFRHVKVKYAGSRNAGLDKIKLRIRQRQRVVATEVIEEEQRILKQIQRWGYPFPTLAKRTVNVDRDHHKVDLTLVFDPGGSASFGEVRVEGLETLDDKYIQRQVPWQLDDPYDAKELDDFERKLLGTGLFSSVHVGLQESTVETNAIPVLIRLSERSKRTIRLGINYTDTGPGAKGYWEHRSLFGGGEKLETSLEWNPIKVNGNAKFTRSGFLDANQYLVLMLDGTQDRPDAYDASKVTGSAMVLRDFTSSLQGGLGVGYKYSRVEQLATDEHFAHVFLPLQLIFDSRNDRLNPVRGMKLYGRTSYFDDTLGAQSFLKTQLENRHYYMLSDRYRLSSALRLMLGSIDGAALDAVPADERFYAGGGGSIRGYEYQQVGPRESGVPTGGDKAVEFSMELRLQPGRKLGYVAFVDGGTVYDESFDNYDRSLRYGAGMGLRWFTAIGPLRADIAYPLNPSAEQVERVQFYISLGQAF